MIAASRKRRVLTTRCARNQELQRHTPCATETTLDRHSPGPILLDLEQYDRTTRLFQALDFECNIAMCHMQETHKRIVSKARRVRQHKTKFDTWKKQRTRKWSKRHWGFGGASFTQGRPRGGGEHHAYRSKRLEKGKQQRPLGQKIEWSTHPRRMPDARIGVRGLKVSR